jgi:dolichol kinase
MITKLEIKRQLIHITLGLIIVSMLYFDLINYLSLIFATIILINFSILTKNNIKIPIFNFFLKRLERDYEKKCVRAKGFIFYLIGSTFVVYFFSKEIAIACILILAFGDSVSRLVGPYGYLKHPFNSAKFIEGIIAGCFAATIASMFFVPFTYAITASSIAMFIESLEIRINKFKIDDNLTIPIVAGIVMTVLSNFI